LCVSACASQDTCEHIQAYRYLAEGRESLEEDFIIDLIGQITDEDVKVVRGVFFRRVVRLISPVHANLLLMDTSAVKSLHGAFGGAWIVVLDKAVVVAFGLELVKG
jgi:hypothetical protein